MGRQWCQVDPTVKIDGELCHLYITIPMEFKDDVEGIVLEFMLTEGSQGEQVSKGNVFGIKPIMSFENILNDNDPYLTIFVETSTYEFDVIVRFESKAPSVPDLVGIGDTNTEFSCTTVTKIK
jgi:hypothetical protein